MKQDDLCIGTLDNKRIEVYISIDEVKKMCDEKILNENVKLFKRVFELEEENDKLRQELAEYPTWQEAINSKEFNGGEL